MKKDFISKVLAGMLVISMLFGVTACGNQDDKGNTQQESSGTQETGAFAQEESSQDSSAEESTEKKEIDMSPLSITVLLNSDAEMYKGKSAEYDELVAQINEYTQMDITWDAYTQANYDEQVNLMIMTDGAPEVFVVTKKDATFAKAVQEDVVWDITDYIDDYDNLATIPQAVRENASINGRLYGLPKSRTLARNGFGYRVDWLNNLGLKAPTTWDEFKDMLYAFTFKDPDGDGSNNTIGLYLDSWTGAFDVMQVWFGAPNKWGIDENGDLIPAHMTQEYKNAMKAFRELYELGVINKDFRDLKAGSAVDSGLSTSIGGAGIQVLDGLRKVETRFESDGMAAEFTLGGYLDTGLGPYCLPTDGYNGMVCISKKRVKTEDELRRVLQFLNDLNDGEMVDLITFGWEGITYSLDENGYGVKLSNEERTQAGLSDLTFGQGFNQALLGFTAPENAAKLSVAPYTEEIRLLEQKLYDEDIQYCVVNYGASYISDYYTQHGSDLDNMVEQARLKFICGEIDEVAFDEQMRTWLSAGGQTVIDEMNKLYHAAGN